MMAGYARIRVDGVILPAFFKDGRLPFVEITGGLPEDAELIGIERDPSIPFCWCFTFRADSLSEGREPIELVPLYHLEVR